MSNETSDTRSHPTGDELLTVAEICDRLKISANAFYLMRTRGNGPKMFRLGKALRCRESAFEAWLSEISK